MTEPREPTQPTEPTDRSEQAPMPEPAPPMTPAPPTTPPPAIPPPPTPDPGAAAVSAPAGQVAPLDASLAGGQPAPAPSESALDAYIRANQLRYSEAALRRAALAAGNSPAAVEAAIVRARPDAARGAGARAARIILGAYVAAFVVLGIGMVVNALGTSGNVYGGIGVALIVWGIVLVVGYGASMIWVASRRAGLIVLGLLVAFVGLSIIGTGSIGAMLGLGVGVVVVVAAIAFGSRVSRGVSSSMPVLLSVPLLILLALGGACVATGLPLPGGFAT